MLGVRKSEGVPELESHEGSAQFTKDRETSNLRKSALASKVMNPLRTMCGSRTGGWPLPGVMSD
jgi:hypothetical protein